MTIDTVYRQDERGRLKHFAYVKDIAGKTVQESIVGWDDASQAIEYASDNTFVKEFTAEEKAGNNYEKVQYWKFDVVNFCLYSFIVVIICGWLLYELWIEKVLFQLNSNYSNMMLSCMSVFAGIVLILIACSVIIPVIKFCKDIIKYGEQL